MTYDLLRTTAAQIEAAFEDAGARLGRGWVMDGIRTVTAHLATHLPALGPDRNELPNRPLEL